MCGLCQLQNPFSDPMAAHNPLDNLKAKALQLKKDIAMHERTAQTRATYGMPLCKASAERLATMRAEQFELARQL